MRASGLDLEKVDYFVYFSQTMMAGRSNFCGVIDVLKVSHWGDRGRLLSIVMLKALTYGCKTWSLKNVEKYVINDTGVLSISLWSFDIKTLSSGWCVGCHRSQERKKNPMSGTCCLLCKELVNVLCFEWYLREKQTAVRQTSEEMECESGDNRSWLTFLERGTWIATLGANCMTSIAPHWRFKQF